MERIEIDKIIDFLKDHPSWGEIKKRIISEKETKTSFSNKEDLIQFYARIYDGRVRVFCNYWGNADIVTNDTVYCVGWGKVDPIDVCRHALAFANFLNLRAGVIISRAYKHHYLPVESEGIEIIFY